MNDICNPPSLPEFVGRTVLDTIGLVMADKALKSASVSLIRYMTPNKGTGHSNEVITAMGDYPGGPSAPYLNRITDRTEGQERKIPVLLCLCPLDLPWVLCYNNRKAKRRYQMMLLIKNGRIKTMVSPDVEGGCVLIDDAGKIAAVGPCIEEAPDMTVTVIDAGGRLVTPGCVEAHCHIGVHNSAMRWEGADFNERSDPLTPQMRAIDGINPMDETFALAIRHGVTSACTGPGSANVVGGTFAAIKLVGKRVDDMVIREPVAMKCAFGENPKGVYGQNGGKAPVTRMATAAMLRELLFKARNYVAAKEAAAHDGGKEPAFDMKLEAMIPVIKKEIPLKAHAHRADDIFTAIRIAKEFDVLLTLDHCTEGALIAEELAGEGYPAFVGPSFGSKTKIELANKDFTTPGILHAAGVSVSIITDAPVIPLEYLPMCAGFAVRAGLPYEEGWRAITINPAVRTGIGDRVGSLEAGKDGDVVIWQGDPLLEVGAEAYVTVVDGKVVYSAEA